MRPSRELVRVRALVGAAHALFGWLKYPNTLPDRFSWIAAYTSGLGSLIAAKNGIRSVPDATGEA